MFRDGLRTTTGPTDLRVGAVADGQALKRVGSTLVGATLGDFVGPVGATDNAVVRFDGVTGKLGQNSTVTIDDSGNITLPGGATVDGVDISVLGANAVAGPASADDNAITRFNGTTGKVVQNSAATIDDSGNLITAGYIATSSDVVATGNLDCSIAVCDYLDADAGIIRGDVTILGDVTMDTGKTVDGIDIGEATPSIVWDGGMYMSPLPRFGGALTTGAAGYWVYLGKTTRVTTPGFVLFFVTVAGAGAQTAEIGLFSTAGPPNQSNKSLVKIEASGSVQALTSTGLRRNSSAFTTQVAAGTHLWAGIRIDMATTEPTITGLGGDLNTGSVLSAASPGALTGAGPFTGGVPTPAFAWQVPDLQIYI